MKPIALAADKVVAEIYRQFSRSAVKRRVRYAIKIGAGHHENFARYGERVAIIGAAIKRWQIAHQIASQFFDHTAHIPSDVALTIAVSMVDGWYREERDKCAVAAALGRANRLSLEVLSELRLMLRLLRRSNFRGHELGLAEFTIGGRKTGELIQ